MNAHEKRWLLMGVGLIVIALIIGLTTGCTIKQLPSEEPVALPTAPERETTTTRATTTTTTLPTFGWLENYCYSDCTRAFEDEAASYVQATTVEAIADVLRFFQGLTYAQVDQTCEAFWNMSDSDIWAMAFDNGLDPDAWVAAQYLVCDS